MGKGKAIDYKKSKGAIRDLARALHTDTRKGYKQATNSIDAIYGNLSGFKRGGKLLNANNVRQLNAVLALAERAGRGPGQVTRAAHAAGGDTALSRVVAAEFRPAGTIARTGKDVLGAQVKNAVRGVRTGNQVVKIATAGAKEAQAAANYAASKALESRQTTDATLIAQERLQLQQLRLQAQLAEEQAAQQHEYNLEEMQAQYDMAEKAAKQELGDDFIGAQTLANALPGMSQDIRRAAEERLREAMGLPDEATMADAEKTWNEASAADRQRWMEQVGNLRDSIVKSTGAVEGTAEYTVAQKLAGIILSRHIYGPGENINKRSDTREAEEDAIEYVLRTSYPQIAEKGGKAWKNLLKSALALRDLYGKVGAPDPNASQGGSQDPEEDGPLSDLPQWAEATLGATVTGLGSLT